MSEVVTAAGRVGALYVAAALVSAVSVADAAEEHPRRGDTHVHGVGTLDIAVEGVQVAMELRVPAADVLGFEHSPRTGAQHRAVDEARAVLADPIHLFGPSPDASCRAEPADPVLAVEDEEEGGAHHATHAEFHVRHRLVCDSIERLEAFSVRYFEAFPAAESLVVNVIGAAKQSRRILEPDSIVVGLAGHF